MLGNYLRIVEYGSSYYKGQNDFIILLNVEWPNGKEFYAGEVHPTNDNYNSRNNVKLV